MQAVRIGDVVISVSFDGPPIGSVQGYSVTIAFPDGESFVNDDFVATFTGATLHDGVVGFLALLGACGLAERGCIDGDYATRFPREVAVWASHCVAEIDAALSSLDPA